MAFHSISTFPSDLLCNTTIMIAEGRYKMDSSIPPSNQSVLKKYTESPSGVSTNEKFSAIEYAYKAPSVEESSDEESVLPEDASTNLGTVLYTPRRSKSAAAIPIPTSVLQLDPLSSFSVHQQDRREISYIAPRAYPSTVRQVHGSLALHNEKLIKAITDAAGGELDWNKIKMLDLSGKGLTSLHGLADWVPNLWNLNIDDNEIEHLVGCPRDLLVLSANNNRLSDMTSWAHLPHLCRLKAAGNNFEHLDGLVNSRHLTELDVSRNHIRQIDALGWLGELRILDVSDNMLERVPWAGWAWKRLTHLKMGMNVLYTIDSLDSLPNLELLDLEHNEINSFGEDAKQVHRNLRKLNLKTNSIMNFDFQMFPALQELDLDENLIMSASSLQYLSRARKLLKLSLRAQKESQQSHQNKLINTMMDTPCHAQELYLSENLTTCSQGRIAMPPNFKHRNIRKLEMVSCGITELPTNFGQYFPACHTLNLNFNAIQDITELRGMQGLQKLHVARNYLNSPRRVAVLLPKFPELINVDIRENSFNQGWYNTMPGNKGEVTREYPPGSEIPGEYELPGRIEDRNTRWYKRLPSSLRLPRLMMSLLLAQGCPQLEEVDGAEWNRNVYLNDVEGKQELCEAGMLNHKGRQPRTRYITQ